MIGLSEMLVVAVPSALLAYRLLTSGQLAWWRSRYRMHRVPAGTAREVQDRQPVRLRGRVEVDEARPLLRAPLSGRECVAYRVNVTQQEGRSMPALIIDRYETVAFWVQDATGRAYVRGDAICWPEMKTLADVNAFSEVSEPFERYLRQFGHRSRGLVFTRPTEFEEGVILPGDEVVVAGLGAIDRSMPSEVRESSYRQDAGCPVVEAFDDGELLVSNRR